MKDLLKMREPVNTCTHFITFIGAIVGLVFLIVLTKNNVSKLITSIIYGSSLIMLYGASSLYHWLRTTPSKILLLKKFDHVAIYFLIAGSYTPIFYYGLTETWKWVMLITVWVLAIIGMILKLWLILAPRYVSAAFYLTLGWIALVPFLQLIKTLPLEVIILMIIGGVFYTIGAVIYATKCFDFFPSRFGFHEIFHLFIMFGSIVHFVMILRYVVPL